MEQTRATDEAAAASHRVEVEGDELRELCGQQDAYLRLIEEGLGVRLKPESGQVTIHGEGAASEAAAHVLQGMLGIVRQG